MCLQMITLNVIVSNTTTVKVIMEEGGWVSIWPKKINHVRPIISQ